MVIRAIAPSFLKMMYLKSIVASFCLATDLATDEFRFAFFDESASRFLVILCTAGKRLAQRFAIEVGREARRQRGVEVGFHVAVGDARTARNALGDGFDLFHQGRRGNDAINQTDVERFVGADNIRQKVEFARFGRSYELSQRVGAAEVAGESDFGEGGAEARAVSREAEVASHRK